jgi:hypothetical protein
MNSMIPLMGRGPQINDPLETAGNAASLSNLLQVNQMRQRQMDAEDAQQAAQKQRMVLAKRAWDEAMTYWSDAVDKERSQAAEQPAVLPPGAPMPGSANSLINQGQGAVMGPGGVMQDKAVNVTSRMPLSDPKFHEIFAAISRDYGLSDISDQAMKHRSELLKEQAPQSELGKIMEDLKGKGPLFEAMGKSAMWNKLKGNPDPGFAWDPETGDLKPVKEVQDFMMKLREKGAAKMQMFNNTKDDFKNERDLRNDFKSEPIYKAHTEVKSAYSQIKAGIEQNSPAGDLAAATKFMKILDPTSVVRESELNMAIEASGLGDRAMNLLPRIINGVKLTPAQRKDFGKLAKEFYDLSEKAYQDKATEYKGVAKDYGLNADRVGGSAQKPPPAPASGGLTPEEKAELEQLRKELGK